MAASLADITSDAPLRAPRFILHGIHGVGKTSFPLPTAHGPGAPHPVVVQTEDGLGPIKVPHFPLATTYRDVMEQLTSLATEPHEYATLLLDSLDWLEPLVWAETCRRSKEGHADIEAFGYGKGYIAAAYVWREVRDLLNAIRDRGCAIICTAHSEIKRFDAPDTDPFDRYQIKLQARAAAMWEEWADVVAFANWRTFVSEKEVGFNKKIARGIGTGQRVMHLEERPAYKAKNRYSLPAELPLSWQAFEAALTASATAPAHAPINED